MEGAQTMKTYSQSFMALMQSAQAFNARKMTETGRTVKNSRVIKACLWFFTLWLAGSGLAAAQLPPTVISGPTNQVQPAGEMLSLAVTTGGGPVQSYQWFKDSRRLCGATNSTFTATNAGMADSGSYYVVLTNMGGMVISLPALVAVDNPKLVDWGENGSGQLGNGTTGETNRPITIIGDVVTGSAGSDHALFLTSDGTLWAMGQNKYGQLGNNTRILTNRPAAIQSNVVAVAAGFDHSLFVKNDGSLWAMGENNYGQLGNGNSSGTSSNPKPINVASNVTAVAAGVYHSLYIKNDGTLWAMGYNYAGQLGDGVNTAYDPNPTPVSVASNVVAVAAGYLYSLFITSDGKLWTMGDNRYGQLGDGMADGTNLPTSVASNVLAVASGFDHSLFVTDDGTLWAMGRNSFGQLGDGTINDTNLPESVASNVVAVAGGQYFSLFVKTDRTIWVMGDNRTGQLGNGTTTATNVPNIVPHVYSVANVFPADNALYSMVIGANQTAAAITMPNGIPTLSFPGIPGKSYSVARSTNLLGYWSVIWTTNEPPLGIFQITDPVAPQPNAYYRLLANP